jgi:hypothetical protein
VLSPEIPPPRRQEASARERTIAMVVERTR